QRSRDVAAAGFAHESPAVVCAQGPDVDDREIRFGQTLAQLGRGDVGSLRSEVVVEDGHRGFPFECCSLANKTPAEEAGVRCVCVRTYTRETLRYTTCPAGRRSNRYSA